MSELSMETYEVVNDLLVIKWEDGVESYIPLKKLRDRCPCAGCGGETDALGNVYVSAGQAKSEASYQLINLKPIGYYAVQLFLGRWTQYGNLPV